MSASGSLRLGAFVGLAFASGACQLFLGGEDYVLDPGSGGAGGAGGATVTTTSSGGGGTTTTTTTSGGGGEGGVGGGGGGGGSPPIVSFGTPEILATGRGALRDVVADGTHAYYVVSGAAPQTGLVEALTLNDLSTAPLLPSLTTPRGLLLDGGQLYTTSGPTDAADTLCRVLRVPTSGGAATTLQSDTSSTNCYHAVGLATGFSLSSWMPDPLGANRAHLRRATLSPIAPVGASGLSHAEGVPIPALLGLSDSVYWVDRTQGTVYRRALSNSVQLNQSAPGSSVVTLATNQSQATDLAHRAGTLYVVSDAGVASVSTSTPGATTLTTLASDPRGVSVDESHVYWADTGTNRIRAVPLSGGTPVTVWDAGTEEPFDTFSTSTFIYATTEQGSVVRVPKTVQ